MRDRRRQAIPVRGFLFEVAPSRASERVELGAAIVLARLPLRGDPALVLELVQRGVELSVAHLQDVTGYLLEALPDGPAVERLEGEDFENQQVQRALDEIGWPAHGASLGYRELHRPVPLGK